MRSMQMRRAVTLPCLAFWIILRIRPSTSPSRSCSASTVAALRAPGGRPRGLPLWPFEKGRPRGFGAWTRCPPTGSTVRLHCRQDAKGCNETAGERLDGNREHDRYGRGRLHRGTDRACRRDDDIYFALYELGGNIGVTVSVAFCPAIFDGDGAPSVQPSSCRRFSKALTDCCQLPAELAPRNPIVGSTGCCARVASGHAAAEPAMPLMRSRRLLGRPATLTPHSSTTVNADCAMYHSKYH
jgi:hypothetical protein